MMPRRTPRTISIFLALSTAAILIGSAAHAAAPIPEVVDSLISQGRWAGYVNMMDDARARGFDEPVERKVRSLPQLAAGVAVFDYRVPCILVDFSDNPASGGKIASTPQMFDSLLFSTSPANPTGSFKDYYKEISYGQMNVLGTVVGWFRMPETYAYYVDGKRGMGSSPHNAARLVESAIDSASHYLDFSQFDNNHDGFVDGVQIVFPGPGFEETGDTNQIQSHRFHTTLMKFYNGVYVSDYTIQPEETARPGGDLNSIGVFCHEWGHILGLVDLYDIDTDPAATSWGLGAWSLMATGNYNGPPGLRARTPAHPDAWSKIKLGFITPAAPATIPNTNLTNVSIPQAETSPTVYKLWTGGFIPATNQYFLVENRQKTGFDEYLPGQGLLIYHVDPTMGTNRYQWIENQSPWSGNHYLVALEQADGFFNLEYNTANYGDGGDVYYSDSAGFDGLSYPSSRGYNGNPSQVAVWNISAPDSIMTANLDVVYSRPFLKTRHWVLSDPTGNNNGIADPNETVQLVFDLNSVWQATSNIDVTVSAPGSGLTFVDSVFHVTNIGSNTTVNNSGDPILISVPPSFRSRKVTFTFTSTANGGASRWVNDTTFEIGPPHELIVDDDRGGAREVKVQDALNGMGEVYRTWNVSARGNPPLDTMLSYPVVIWMTGDSNSISPTHAAVLTMKSFLDNNGHLFLTGQDIAENLTTGPDSSFFFDYFGVRYLANETHGAVLNGVSSDPISNGINLNAQAADGAVNQKSPDIIDVIPGSLAVKSYGYMFDGGAMGGVHIERNGYRAVFFSFGFEAITSQQSQAQFPFATRVQAMTPIITWLDGDIATDVNDQPGDGIVGAGVPNSFELAQNYPNPFNAGTVIPYTVSGNRLRQVRLEIFDILGRQVRVLLDEPMVAGHGQINWDGTDKHGIQVASGVYFYRLSIAGEGATAKRMVVLK
ncbi:MAG: M6 family metalloprotease domain-containing protein [candidate division Zixibacteria bacterium]|nr:M6 family metalloprotease domain-containing protein [candidate division Zixibacteria bacterium]